MKHLRVLVLLVFVSQGPAPRLGGAEETARLAGSVVEEFDVYNDGDFLLIPVKVHGKTYPFVLDTGCSATVIDISLTLGCPVDEVEMGTAEGKAGKKLQLYLAPPMRVGKIAWQSSKPVVGVDLALMRAISGHKFYGFLGMDFLRSYAVQFDNDRGKVRLLGSPAQPVGRPVPIIFLDPRRTMPWVVADIPGWGPELFNIDTGDIGYGGLRKDLFRTLARRGVVEGLAESKHCTILGIEKCYGGFIDHFVMEDARHPPISLGESPFAHSDLGLRFWRRYNLVMDFPRQTLYLEKSRWFREKEPCDYSGIRFKREAGKTAIEEISEGSPAALAGLKPGDVLVQIAHMDAAAIRLIELVTILGTEGKRFPIVYQRGETRTKVILRLGPWQRTEPQPAFLKEEEAKETRAFLLTQRGIACVLKKNLDGAIADFDAALAVDPGHGDALMCRGQAWGKKKDFGKALADLGEAIRSKPKDLVSYFCRAEVHMACQVPTMALADYQEILRLDPKNSLAMKAISRISWTQGDLKTALAKVEAAVCLDPRDPEALVLRGCVLWMMKKNDEGLAEFNKAIALDPQCGPAFETRGTVYLERNEVSKALADLNEAIHLGQRTPQVYLNRAVIWHQRKEYGKALADLTETVGLDPDNAMALHGLAWNLASCPQENLRDGPKALTHAMRACALTRFQNPGTLEVLAAAHAECGDFRAAVRWQKEALQAYPAQTQYVELARTRLDLYEKGQPNRDKR